MATISALKFDTPDGAEQMLQVVQGLAKQHLVKLQDSLQSKVTEDTSALFLMTSDATQDKIVDALKEYKFHIITTNLSVEQEAALRKAFGDDGDAG